jgi:transcriptional regulator GlxA family with amidase domain
MLRDLGVEVNEQRCTQDGRVWTTAGVSAGMDMLLACIAAANGEDADSRVQLHAEYFPEGRIYGNARTEQPVVDYIACL